MSRSPEKFTRRESFKFVAAGLAGIVFPSTCLLCDFLELIDPEPTSTPKRTPRPTPTPTTQPTKTLIPPTPMPTATPKPTETPVPQRPFEIPLIEIAPIAEAPVEGKWILIDLSEQTLVAYEGTTPVQAAWVSTGLPGVTRTHEGDFYIQTKDGTTTMSGVGYHLEDVESTMYYDRSTGRGYAIHGAWWHENFGHPMSHGCINMDEPDAAILYEWAEVGTMVRIQE